MMIVNFPEKVWGRLASIADNRDVSIADLIVETAQGLLNVPHQEPSEPVPRSSRRKRQPLDWDAVARLNREGLTDADIARTLGQSHNGVGEARRRMGLRSNFVARLEVDTARLVELHGLNRSDVEIGRALGISADTARDRRLELGLPPVNSNTNPKEGNRA